MNSEPLTKKTGRLFIGHEEEADPKRILIIEDSPEDLELIERKLNNLHAIVDQAAASNHELSPSLRIPR